jgi:hypothetical protein
VLQWLHLVGFERDLGAFHQWLYAHNRAVPAGQPLPGVAPDADDALAQVVQRIRRLVEPPGGAHDAPHRLAADGRATADELTDSRTEESSR